MLDAQADALYGLPLLRALGRCCLNEMTVLHRGAPTSQIDSAGNRKTFTESGLLLVKCRIRNDRAKEEQEQVGSLIFTADSSFPFRKPFQHYILPTQNVFGALLEIL